MPSIKQRYRKARKRYIGNPSNENLKWFLMLKGRLGRFDERMMRYYGKSSRGLSAEVKKFIARGYAYGLVPTSTSDGVHAPGSYHGLYRAVDLGVRRHLVGTAAAVRKMSRFQRSEYRRGGHTELIGPDNTCNVLRGSRTSLAEGSSLEQAHDNHVHGAY